MLKPQEYDLLCVSQLMRTLDLPQPAVAGVASFYQSNMRRADAQSMCDSETTCTFTELGWEEQRKGPHSDRRRGSWCTRDASPPTVTTLADPVLDPVSMVTEDVHTRERL
jgi:hypothetical protein